LSRKSWSFDLRYLLGQPPWDTKVTPPEVVELVEGEGLPFGRALDLGCGTGTNVDLFDLALDIGCLHSLPPEGWGRYAAGVARLVRPGYLYLLYAFTPRPDQSIPRGVAPEKVRSLFTPAFAVEREERGEDPSGPRSAWYWLQRLWPAPT
jgi:hypothetical protein